MHCPREHLGSVSNDGFSFTPWAISRDPRPREALRSGIRDRSNPPKHPGESRKNLRTETWPLSRARSKGDTFLSEMRWGPHDLGECGFTEARIHQETQKNERDIAPVQSQLPQHNQEASRRDATLSQQPPLTRSSSHTNRKRGHLPANLPTFLGVRPLKLLAVRYHVSSFQNSRLPEPPPPMQSQSGSIASSPGARKRQR